VVYHSSPIHTTLVKQLNDVIKGTVSRLCPGSMVVFHEKKICTSALIGIHSSQCFLTVFRFSLDYFQRRQCVFISDIVVINDYNCKGTQCISAAI